MIPIASKGTPSDHGAARPPAPVVGDQEQQSREKKRFIWAPCLLLGLLVTILAYHDSLRNGFTWDDEYVIVDNTSIRSLWNIPSFFVDPATSAASAGLATVYRPLRTLALAMVFAVAGPEPAAYHALSLAIHLLNVSLVVLLARRLWLPVGAAISAGALFAVHPLASEAVTSATAIGDLLCASFFLAATIAHLSAREGRLRVRLFVLVGLLFVLSIASKEMAYSFPLVALLGDRVLPRRESYAWPPVGYRPYVAGLVGISAAMFGLRWALLGKVAQASEWPGGTLVRTLAMSLDALGRYVALLFHPTPLTARHVVPIPESLPGPRALLGLAVLIALLFALVRLHRLPAAGWGITWFLVTLSPAMNLLPIQGDFMGERYAYLPMIGLVLAVVALAEAATQALPRAAQRWSALAVSLFVVVTALATASRVRVWRDNRTLFEDAVEVSPGSNAVRLNLVREYERLGRDDLAREQLFAATANTRRYRDLYLRLGAAARGKNHRGEARIWYERALRMDPENATAQAGLAELGAISPQAAP